jgi:hypothetical protein
MAESLNRSVEELKSPVCTDCNRKMVWYRSIRASATAEDIVHFFQCLSCNGIVETKTKIQSGGKGQKSQLNSACPMFRQHHMLGALRLAEATGV